MGARFLKIAVFYFLLGVVVGLVLGSTESFQYASAHAHINLLGWVSLALSGMIYHLFPKAGSHGLAKVHFWLHNIGLPLLVIGMVGFANNIKALGIPCTAVGGILVIIAVLCFAINVWKNVSSDSNEASSSNSNKISM
jgi:cbb3-type cytochrome oxidase subunit 1